MIYKRKNKQQLTQRIQNYLLCNIKDKPHKVFNLIPLRNPIDNNIQNQFRRTQINRKTINPILDKLLIHQYGKLILKSRKIFGPYERKGVLCYIFQSASKNQLELTISIPDIEDGVNKAIKLSKLVIVCGMLYKKLI